MATDSRSFSESVRPPEVPMRKTDMAIPCEINQQSATLYFYEIKMYSLLFPRPHTPPELAVEEDEASL